MTAMKSGVVLYSGRECIVYFIELTIPFEDVIEEAFERKRYVELVAEGRERGWQAHIRPVEMGIRGFVTKSTTTLLLDLGVLKEFSDAAVKCKPVVMAEALTDYLGTCELTCIK